MQMQLDENDHEVEDVDNVNRIMLRIRWGRHQR